MFRFTIRDVLWLMVVVGMGVGWWMDRSRISRMQSELDRSQGELGHLSRAVWEGGYDPRVIIRDPRRDLKRAKLQVDPKTKALRAPDENSN
jgi:hypothetical protein